MTLTSLCLVFVEVSSNFNLRLQTCKLLYQLWFTPSFGWCPLFSGLSCYSCWVVHPPLIKWLEHMFFIFVESFFFSQYGSPEQRDLCDPHHLVISLHYALGQILAEIHSQILLFMVRALRADSFWPSFNMSHVNCLSACFSTSFFFLLKYVFGKTCSFSCHGI